MGARGLMLVWLSLMALTLLTGVSARVGDAAHPGAMGLVLLAGVTIVKARLILNHYLRLNLAPSFSTGLTVAFAAVLALVTASFLIPFRSPVQPVRSDTPPPASMTSPSTSPAASTG